MMNIEIINKKISYIKATTNPLSADIGIIKEDNAIWLFDVGNNLENITLLNDAYNIVISHFHIDHIGILSKIKANKIYVSKETYKHLPPELKMKDNIIIVTKDLKIGNLTIFLIPSSHAKGCLGLEVDESYTFLGDATYSKFINQQRTFNSQLLKEEIQVIKSLKSQYVLLSHQKDFIRKKEDVVLELEKIYSLRNKNAAQIIIKDN